MKEAAPHQASLHWTTCRAMVVRLSESPQPHLSTPQPIQTPSASHLSRSFDQPRGTDRWYRVRSLRPSRQGVVPTDCLMIQLPSVTRGMSLKVALRRASASALSPPARNLCPPLATFNCGPVSSPEAGCESCSPLRFSTCRKCHYSPPAVVFGICAQCGAGTRRASPCGLNLAMLQLQADTSAFQTVFKMTGRDGAWYSNTASRLGSRWLEHCVIHRGLDSKPPVTHTVLYVQCRHECDRLKEGCTQAGPSQRCTVWMHACSRDLSMRPLVIQNLDVGVF